MPEFRNITVAVDTNDSVGELLGYAESIALKFNAKIWVIHVLEDQADKDQGSTSPDDEIASKRNMEALCDGFIEDSLEREILVLNGPTVDRVLEQVKDLGSDLLIVGTHKYSFLHNLISRRVSIQLFKKSNIPILAIPFEDN